MSESLDNQLKVLLQQRMRESGEDMMSTKSAQSNLGKETPPPSKSIDTSNTGKSTSPKSKKGTTRGTTPPKAPKKDGEVTLDMEQALLDSLEKGVLAAPMDFTDDAVLQPYSGKVILFVYDPPKCLRCAHLIPGAPKEFDSCHFSAGNESCPAAQIRILKGVNVEGTATDFANAILSNNLAKVGELSADLASRSPLVSHLVGERVKEKLKGNVS